MKARWSCTYWANAACRRLCQREPGCGAATELLATGASRAAAAERAGAEERCAGDVGCLRTAGWGGVSTAKLSAAVLPETAVSDERSEARPRGSGTMGSVGASRISRMSSRAAAAESRPLRRGARGAAIICSPGFGVGGALAKGASQKRTRGHTKRAPSTRRSSQLGPRDPRRRIHPGTTPQHVSSRSSAPGASQRPSAAPAGCAPAQGSRPRRWC